MKKYLVMMGIIAAFTAMTTVYAQNSKASNHDWKNPVPMDRLAVVINANSRDKKGLSSDGKVKFPSVKLSPGEKPERFGSENVIPSQNPGDADEVWLPLKNTGGTEESAQTYLYNLVFLEKDTWKKYTFAFIPQTDGRIEIIIGNRAGKSTYGIPGATKGDLVNWGSFTYGKIEAKNLQLKGIALANEKDLKEWNATIDKKDRDFAKVQPVFLKGPKAPDGRPGVEVFSQLSQFVDVKKGQQIEISFYARPGRYFIDLRNPNR